MHDACLMEYIVQTLDKPCPRCDHFYRGPLVLSRARVDNFTRNKLAYQNEKLFRGLLASITIAYFIVLWDYQDDNPSLASLVCAQIGRMCLMPFFTIALAVVVYNHFQRYTGQPSNRRYFEEHSRMTILRDPTSQKQMVFFIRSICGLLMDKDNGKTIRLVNKRVNDTKSKWRLHRLMEP